MQQMQQAYQAAQRIVRVQMTDEERGLLGAMRQSDIVVVRGGMDHAENVLSTLDVRHRAIEPGSLGAMALNPRQLLMVNCPGRLTKRGMQRVEAFVRDGGTLFTTDWALQNLLEPLFPGMVSRTRRTTADEVVRLDAPHARRMFRHGILSRDSDPVWWLETASYPIRVLSRRVKVLLRSDELKASYRNGAVLVRFPHGAGEVYHMISHFYLQRVEARTGRHRGDWRAYARALGAAVPSEASRLSLGAVEAAHTSLSVLMYVTTEKLRRMRRG